MGADEGKPKHKTERKVNKAIKELNKINTHEDNIKLSKRLLKELEELNSQALDEKLNNL